MTNDSTSRILSSLVRTGSVSSLNPEKHQARVYYEDVGMVSDWLPVIQKNNADSTAESPPWPCWMPKVGEQVLVLYLPMFNGEGFVLGRIP